MEHGYDMRVAVAAKSSDKNTVALRRPEHCLHDHTTIVGVVAQQHLLHSGA
jgi:hypothetical protein